MNDLMNLHPWHCCFPSQKHHIKPTNQNLKKKKERHWETKMILTLLIIVLFVRFVAVCVFWCCLCAYLFDVGGLCIPLGMSQVHYTVYNILIKRIFRDDSCDSALNFHKIRDFLHFGNGIRCMNLTLKGIVKICPRLITKRHWLLIFQTVNFFQTDNQSTVGTNITGNHNKRQHD